MFKGEQASADQGLTEFVPEITGAVGGLDQDLFRGLVEPGPFGHELLPGLRPFSSLG